MEQRARPRALTLTLPDSLQPYLIFEGKRYALRNFSEEGLGLWVPPATALHWSVGKRIQAELGIEKEKFAVELEVVHQEDRYSGLRLKHESPKLKKIFKKLLEPAFYASEVVPHAKWGSDDPKTSAFRAWYAAGAGTELVVWVQEAQKMVLGLQLCWQAKWVYRKQYQPAQTGFLKDEGIVLNGTVRPAGDLIAEAAPSDKLLIQEAARFLTSLPRPIAGTLLWQFLETGEQVYLPAPMFAIRKVA